MVYSVQTERGEVEIQLGGIYKCKRAELSNVVTGRREQYFKCYIKFVDCFGNVPWGYWLCEIVDEQLTLRQIMFVNSETGRLYNTAPSAEQNYSGHILKNQREDVTNAFFECSY